jgi:RimJ/RimL family protein N-acetyltransferase
MTEPVLRPMREDDLPALFEIQCDAAGQVDVTYWIRRDHWGRGLAGAGAGVRRGARGGDRGGDVPAGLKPAVIVES